VGVPGQVLVKTAAATPPAEGTIVETVTRKRVIDASDATNSNKTQRTTPDFWEYVEKLTAPEWERHIVYIYRRDGEVGPTPQLEKCAGVLTLPDGSRVFFNDREEVEGAIGQKYGGGTYRLILKRGHERICEGRIIAEGPRKTPPAAPAGVYASYAGDGLTVTSSDATADVAHHAITTLSGQDRLAVDVGVNALRSAAEVVQRFSQPHNPPPPSATDDLLKQAMAAMLHKMLNPPPTPDPLELITKLLAVVGQLNGGGGSGGTNPVIARVLDAAVEKLLNPGPAGPASDNAGAELVRQLPSVAGYVMQSIHEWRVGTEAQRDAVAIARGVPVPAARAAGPLPPAPLPHAAGAPAPVAPEGEVVGQPSLEFIESKIVEMFREPISADEAADRTVQFIDTMSPALVEQLKSLGEAGILQLFQTRPTLRPALQNLPRLQEFIRAFLKYANEGDAPPPSSRPV